MEGLQTKVAVPLLFDDSGKTVRRIHGNKMPSDNELDFITNYYLPVDPEYVRIAYPTASLGQKAHFVLLKIGLAPAYTVRKVASCFPRMTKRVHRAGNATFKRTPLALIRWCLHVGPTLAVFMVWWSFVEQRVSFRL